MDAPYRRRSSVVSDSDYGKCNTLKKKSSSSQARQESQRNERNEVRNRDIAEDRKQKEERSRGQQIAIGSAFIFLKIKVEIIEPAMGLHK